jgi:hypothetical protein
MAGPYPYPESPYPPSLPYPEQVQSAYPGALPPPVPYPGKPRRRRFLAAGLAVLVIAAIAAVVLAIVFAERRHDSSASSGTGLTQDSAKASIQDFLDALGRGDDETIAKHASCGLFDEIKDKQSDMALANLASDAFRRQYGSAQVTSIDKIVTWSPNQAQVLFTMQVKPTGRTQSSDTERQAVAQILIEGKEILVCSYLPRTGRY